MEDLNPTIKRAIRILVREPDTEALHVPVEFEGRCYEVTIKKRKCNR